MNTFAVIDTETNWADQVMSIGAVIASEDTFRPVAAKYYVLTPECAMGGMYSEVLFLDTSAAPILCTREKAMEDFARWLRLQGVTSLFAYNAGFDRNHLPELRCFTWRDIMALAIYRQHNPKIPPWADLCSTGRLKRGYGVESMLRLLSGDNTYRETHNALRDAEDELTIMRLLAQPLRNYPAI